MTADPRELMARSPMSRLQILVVMLTIGLNALDGFDVMSISFASPGIAAEWGIDRAALGIVLSMELIGMGFGSIVLGGLADRIGRRPTILGCTLMMTIGMYMASTVGRSIVALSLWRVLTGLGIGGMLATTNALVAEYANARRRHLCVSLMAIGYPIGAVSGGLVVAWLLRTHDWRSVFQVGAVMTAALIPLVLYFVPESLHWLVRRQPPGALERINRTLAHMGHEAIAALPDLAAEARRRTGGGIFSRAFIATTLIVTMAYSFHMLPFYFILKWVPKIVVDMGFTKADGAGVLVWANVGGATGGLVLGLLSLRYGIKILTMVVLLLTTVLVALLGHTPAQLHLLVLVCAGAGFCSNAAIVGMYAIFAQAFPTQLRASGTGFAIGCARGGSVASPIMAGLLFRAGYGLANVALIMSLGSLIAVAVLALLRLPAENALAGGRD